MADYDRAKLRELFDEYPDRIKEAVAELNLRYNIPEGSQRAVRCTGYLMGKGEIREIINLSFHQLTLLQSILFGKTGLDVRLSPARNEGEFNTGYQRRVILPSLDDGLNNGGVNKDGKGNYTPGGMWNPDVVASAKARHERKHGRKRI